MMEVMHACFWNWQCGLEVPRVSAQQRPSNREGATTKQQNHRCSFGDQCRELRKEAQPPRTLPLYQNY